MCGIAGIIGVKSSDAIHQMVQAMHHRGPDDRGTYSNEQTHLGMARLAIQDLTYAGHQPMISEDGRYIIVFNGEVFNFQELKAGLEKDGHIFSSGTDTEVVFFLYRQYGSACLDYLNGMFAFVVWDSFEKSLFIARDRFGIKPLYYYHTVNRFLFASELKGLMASKEIPFKISKKGLFTLMMYGAVQLPDSIIEGVIALPPAHFMIWKDNNIQIKKYWKLKGEPQSISFEEAKHAFVEKYKEATRLRTISDRKVGVFLSSGLDSATIVANLNRLEVSDVETFTLGFEENKGFKNEAALAKEISSFYGYKNNSVTLSAQKAIDDFDAFIVGIDQPSADGFNTYLVSKYSKELLTVALSGLGGDEILFGYPRNVHCMNRLIQPKGFLCNLRNYFEGKRLFEGKYREINYLLIKTFGEPKELESLYLKSRLLNRPFEINNFLMEDYRIAHDLKQAVQDLTKYNDLGDCSIEKQISELEIRSYMLDQLLRDMDAVSMFHSIEVRFPLLDYKLVEFIFSLPDDFRFRKQENHKGIYRFGKMSYEESGVKYIMAEAYRDQLPKGYLQQKKYGFSLPIFDWLVETRKPEIIASLQSDRLKEFFKLEFLDGLVNKIKATNSLDWNSFIIYVFHEWLIRFTEHINATFTNNFNSQKNFTIVDKITNL